MEIIYLTKYNRSRIENDYILDSGKKNYIHYFPDCSRMKSDYLDKDESVHLPNSGIDKMYFSCIDEREYYFFNKCVKIDTCSECFEKEATMEHDCRFYKPAQSNENCDPKKSIRTIPQSVYLVVQHHELMQLENNEWEFINFRHDANRITKNKYKAIEYASNQFFEDSQPKFVIEILLKEQYFIELIFESNYKINDLELSIPYIEKDQFNKNIDSITLVMSFYI